MHVLLVDDDRDTRDAYATYLSWETLRQLKSRLHTRKIPVVVLSGHSWQEDQVRTSGCERYIQKPCGPAELLEIIRQVAPRRS